MSLSAEESLERSRAYCEQLTRQAARNFYYGMRLLAEPRRSAMFALYAYMRLVDDIADDDDGRPATRRAQDLELFRAQTHDALAGRLPVGDGPARDLWPAFGHMATHYSIPPKVFDEVINAQCRDLEPVAIETFDQLHTYCYQVAGVVGLASIYIWGFQGGPSTEALAVDRGVAFQLTNILRDLREDAARGRMYLPLQELSAMSVTPDDLRRGRNGEPFTRLMRFQIDRARSYYEKSAPLDALIDPSGRPALAAMTAIYRALLDKIASRPQRVLHRRVSLSAFSKIYISWRAYRSADPSPSRLSPLSPSPGTPGEGRGEGPASP